MLKYNWLKILLYILGARLIYAIVMGQVLYELFFIIILFVAFSIMKNTKINTYSRRF